METDCRAVRRFAEPQVEVLTLPCLEKHDIVRVIELGQFVQLEKLGLRIEFGIFTAMGEERRKIVQEMAMPAACQQSIFKKQDSWIKVYLKVTPRDESTRTLCLFFLMPLLGPSVFLPDLLSDLDRDL